MSVIFIAIVGVALVLGLIAGLRLHPLISLLVGSLFLFAVTPARFAIEPAVQDQVFVSQATADGNLIGFKKFIPPGEYFVWNSSRSNGLNSELPVDKFVIGQRVEKVPRDLLRKAEGIDDPSSLMWFETQSDYAPLASMQLISPVDMQSALDSRFQRIAPKLVEGFAKTFRKLGIPVTMAAIVGVCLLRSGAAGRLVQAILALFGARGTAPALTASGFLLGVPVFFDTVFYLLLPLAKAVGRVHPKQFLTAVMAIIVGATMAHSLVPPTPGPLFVVSQLNESLPADNQISIGSMMLAGFLVGGLAASVGFLYGKLCNRWIDLRPDQVADSQNDDSQDNDAPQAMNRNSVVPSDQKSQATSMPLWLAAVPISLPIVLLGGSEIVEFLAARSTESSLWPALNQWTSLANNPSLVFLFVAVISVLILRRFRSSSEVTTAVAQGLGDAGVIVLLTCAGGAFGASLQQLHLAEGIAYAFPYTSGSFGLLITAFFLTAIIRFAQGSATVAMLTSSAILAQTLSVMNLPYHPIYIALAIGCGSKPLPWMNDSGFWQVTTMTGMKPSQTIQTFSAALTIMGLVGFAATMLGAWLLPMR
ncbi:MAG: SLC13 family permease [Planctomycetota bacterium]